MLPAGGLPIWLCSFNLIVILYLVIREGYPHATIVEATRGEEGGGGERGECEPSCC